MSVVSISTVNNQLTKAFGVRDQLAFTENPHIFCARDVPESGVTSYGTIGISAISSRLNGSVSNIHVELVGASYSRYRELSRGLLIIAERVLAGEWTCCPGTIFPGVLNQINSEIYLMSPILWNDKLRTITIGDVKLAWLQVIPISKSEANFARKYGTNALETILEDNEIDIFDLERRQVVGD